MYAQGTETFYTECTQALHRVCPRSTQGTYRVHTDYKQGIHRIHTGYIAYSLVYTFFYLLLLLLPSWSLTLFLSQAAGCIEHWRGERVVGRSLGMIG